MFAAPMWKLCLEYIDESVLDCCRAWCMAVTSMSFVRGALSEYTKSELEQLGGLLQKIAWEKISVHPNQLNIPVCPSQLYVPHMMKQISFILLEMDM